jgi:hypothetical protein
MPCSSDGYSSKHKRGIEEEDEYDDEEADDKDSDSSASDSSSSDEESDSEEEDDSGYGTLDGATRAACALVNLIRAGWKGKDGLKLLPPSVRTWIERHDEVDRQRLLREKKKKEKQHLKAKALHKLSKKEREALGL